MMFVTDYKCSNSLICITQIFSLIFSPVLKNPMSTEKLQETSRKPGELLSIKLLSAEHNYSLDVPDLQGYSHCGVSYNVSCFLVPSMCRGVSSQPTKDLRHSSHDNLKSRFYDCLVCELRQSAQSPFVSTFCAE